ncbi:MAG: hypothetical protein ACE5HA_02045 [Anaerolineae bacterium]
MAKKKSRRGRARRAPKMYPKGAPTSSTIRAGRAQREEESTDTTTPATAPATSQELREEYWYVYNDLKRIAVVAGTLFVILIGLSFVL